MAIVKMQRLRLIGLEEERSALFARLQHLGCVEITESERKLSSPAWSALLRRDASSVGDVKIKLSQVTGALDALKKYAPKKSGLFTIRSNLSEQEFLDTAALEQALAVVADIQKSLSRISRLQSQENHLASTRAGLVPWKSLDLPLTGASTPHVRITLGVFPATFSLDAISSKLEEAAPLSQLIPVFQDRDQHYVVLLCHREDTEAADKVLKPFSFSNVQFRDMTGTPADNITRLDQKAADLIKERQEAEAAIAAYEDQRDLLRHCYDRLQQEFDKELARERLLTNGTILFMEGWAVAEKVDQLTRELGAFTCAFEFSDPTPEDTVPTLLKNPKWMTPINMVTEMYSLPAYNGIDPNPFIFWFFIFFFGFMFADIAYGIILFIGCSLIVWKVNPKNTMGYMFRLGRYLGISTFLMGIVTGGFFGDVITVFGENFLGYKGVNAISLPSLINPLQDPMVVLIIAICIGAVQMLFGQCVHIYMEIRDGHPLEGFLDVVPWWIVFAGIGCMAALGTGPLVLLLGVLALICTQGRHKKGFFGKLFGGIGSLYDVTSWLGDFLSYSRLMALMLATSVIASVMNILGSLPGNIIAFFIIFLIGHTFNIGINLIGTYVHAARLQYLEFFSKFYKEGGVPFKPLSYKTKYVDVIKAGKEAD